MLSLLAAITCLFGGCPPPPQLASGTWAVKVDLGEASCEGGLAITPDRKGAVHGAFTFCSMAGRISGTARSNELLLELWPSAEGAPRLKLRVLIDGDHLRGELDGAVIEGWRGEVPPAPEHKERGGSAEAEDDDGAA